MHLGISDSVGYGPTSSTDFWNGYTPGASGYTIYVNKVSNGPSIFSPANDTELINTAKYIATSINLSPSITTAVEAITWINSQSNMICVNYNYPGIVTSGLVALLDASFTTSYPKGGTGWKDLSDTQSTATLINGVTYLTNNSGSLGYTSSSLQYAELPDLGSLSNFTVSCWFKLNTLPTTSGAAAVVTNVYDLTSKLNFAIGLNRSPTSANICGGFYDGSWRTTTGFTPATGSWYSVDVTYNGSQVIQYLNGTQQSTLTYSGTPQSSGLGIRIGRRWDTAPSSVDFINGEIPFVSIYNRSLTATEILINYNAQKYKFVESFDPEAQAFITAANITDPTQKTAINQLVLDLKSYGIWNSMIAIYPFVGGSATTNKYNLKNTSTFALSFNGGWTHTSTGSLPNGTNAYADTGISPSSNLGSNHNYSVYSRTDNNNGGNTIGSYELGGYVCGENGYVADLQLYLRTSSFLLVRDQINGNYVQFSNTSSLGHFTVNRNSTTLDVYKNGSSIGSSTGLSQALPGTTLSLSAAHVYDFDCVLDYYDTFDDRELAFASFANSSLTSTNISNLRTAVQAFQTTLGRQV